MFYTFPSSIHSECILLSPPSQSRQYFQFDYHGDILNAMVLWSNPYYQDLISIHPVKNPDNMLSIHHFFKTVDFEELYEELDEMAHEINDICLTLPVHLVPPPFASAGCDIAVASNKQCKFETAEINGVGSYLVKNDHVPFFHNPSDKFDLSPWTNFDTYNMHELFGIAPQHTIFPTFRAEIQQILTLLEDYTNANEHKELSLTGITEGYVRYNPRVGREYIMTLRLIEVGNPQAEVYKRVRLVRELKPGISIIDENIQSTVINVLLPLRIVDERFNEFVKMFLSRSISAEQAHLFVIVFSESDASSVQRTLGKLVDSRTRIRVSVVVGESGYSWTKAVDIGMSSLDKGSNLVFIAEVDFNIRPKFWWRCRANAVLNRRIYYPVPFSVYDSDHSQRAPRSLTKMNGHWAFYTFTQVCIYREDYYALKSWGEFKYSVDLFDRAVQNNLEIMQVPDPYLYRVWSDKLSCSSGRQSSQDICRGLKFAVTKDHVALSEYLDDLADKKKAPFRFGADKKSDFML